MSKVLPRLIGAGINLVSLIRPKRAAEIALDVFCTPRAGRHKAHHMEYLQQYSHELVDSQHGQISVFVRPGDGPTILLAHGWESNAFRWRKLLSYLEDSEYNIIMMEAPAHGRSSRDKFTAIWYAEAMVAIVDRYQPRVIVGHSVGGYATSYFLAHYDHASVQRAIILASPDRLSLINDNYFSLLGLSSRVRRYYDSLLEQRFGYDPSYFNASDFMARVDLPGLVIHDQTDDINFYFEGEAIANAWRGGRIVATVGLGHSLQSVQVFELVEQELSAVG